MLILEYSIGLLFSCGLFAVGNWMKSGPQVFERVFFWAPSIAAKYFYFLGWFLMVGGIFGMIFYPALIIFNLI